MKRVKVISVSLSVGVVKRLEAFRVRSSWSRSLIVRRAIEAWLKREGK